MPTDLYANVFDLFNSKQSSNVAHQGDYTKTTFKDFEGFAPKEFTVTKKQSFENDVELDVVLQTIKFHEGDVKDGINGVTDEDLISMVFTRLSHFQGTQFNCKENHDAMVCLETALYHLKLRKERRKQEGLEGTQKI